ncbi:MAG: peptidase domain-containing protein [Chloroflexi bacterium]|nr:peptidase domain-containing protein [Chloroflexota bacterium]
MKRKVFLTVLPLVIAVVVLLPTISNAALKAPMSLPDPALENVWNRSDLPVQQGSVSRTWMWGPGSFDTRQEQYDQAAGGSRLVTYFDKSRMEINNPYGDRSSQWFVTNGLLAKELISGQLQKGDANFEARSPAQIPVAGDPDDPNGPTYATFAGLLSRTPHAAGEQLTEIVDRSGQVGAGGPAGVTAAYYVPETDHAVASVFWDFLNSSGLVMEAGAFREGRLFDPTFFATGFPITEAYWAQAKVAGQVKWVLIQAFERRVMTYTPGNPEGWQVEMGNIGRHYFTWRYGYAGGPNQEPTVAPTRVPTAIPTEVPTVVPTPPPQPTVQPTQEPATYEVCGSTESDVYHEPTCRYVARITHLICWDRPSEAIAAGYRPCNVCNPPTTP